MKTAAILPFAMFLPLALFGQTGQVDYTSPINPIIQRTYFPGKCVPNSDMLVRTDQSAGSNLYQCNSAGNGWTQVGGSGGGGTATSIPISSGVSSLSVSASQHGCGALPIWRVWDTSYGWTGVDAVVDSSGNISLSWTGSITGYVRVSCGYWAPNYGVSFGTSNSTLPLPTDLTGLSFPNLALQCYDASGNSINVDSTLSPSWDVTANVNPSGLTAISGRCVIGAI